MRQDRDLINKEVIYDVNEVRTTDLGTECDEITG